MAEIAFIIDLSRLPPHAIAAYAARCAMRVQPLIARVGGSPELAASLERPTAARRVATGHVLTVEDTAAAEGAEAAAAVAASVPAARHAARAAAYAAHAACAADQAPYAAEAFAGDAARAAHAAAVAAVDPQAAADAAHYADYAAQADYERLVLYNRGDPAVGQPLHCSEDGPLGPLWPEGKPSWL